MTTRLDRALKDNPAVREKLAVQEFPPDVRPELMGQVHACIAEKVEGKGTGNGMHALPAAGDVEVAERLRSSRAENAG